MEEKRTYLRLHAGTPKGMGKRGETVQSPRNKLGRRQNRFRVYMCVHT